MTFTEKNSLRFYTFPLLERTGAGHAVLGRTGGVSREPFASLNLSSSVGDDPDSVRENHSRAFALLGRELDSAPRLRQVHSDRILVAGRQSPADPLPEADGWITDSPEFTLLMRFADCVPILLFDPVRKAAGIAHAGWKGTVAGVAARAVEAMTARFACRPEDILAGIGPSIGPDHYVVGEETIEAVRAACGKSAGSFVTRGGGMTRFDLWAANEAALRSTGVRNIEVAGICTACHTEDWFSHRAENGKTGRFGALIWISRGERNVG
jgi:YfiH family protein